MTTIKDFPGLIAAIEAVDGLRREAEALKTEADVLAADAAAFIDEAKEKYAVKHGPLVFHLNGTLYAASNNFGVPAVSPIHVVTT